MRNFPLRKICKGKKSRCKTKEMSTKSNIENHKTEILLRLEINADWPAIATELNRVVDVTHPQMSEAALGAWLITLWEKAVEEHDAEKIAQLEKPIRVWADYASKLHIDEAASDKGVDV